MTADEEKMPKDGIAEVLSDPKGPDSADADKVSEALPEAAAPGGGEAKAEDPYVGVRAGEEEPFLEPIEEEDTYVYQKGDFLALFLAALRVFAPVILVFIGGIMLVYWFFAR